MIIAIPLDENKKDVCVSFGRAPFVLFYDTESNTREISENPAAQAQGGAGLKAAQFLVDHHTNVLITIRCGQNAAEVLQAAETAIYEAQGGNAEANLAAYLEGKLELLSHFHAGFHGKA